MLNHLVMSWSISRGRDTYGYNICRLDDRNNAKRYRCSGGGYDMQGTVFGDWLSDVFQADLLKLFSTMPNVDCGYGVAGYKKIESLYGLTLAPNGKVSCNGACGLSSMIAIAEAIGLEIEMEYDLRPRGKQGLLGFYVVKKGE